ncbi:hypothetical protein [Arenimonas caeni]|jgi:hypothetical protein|uniref:hypothetical protein n=1 Tax=Arenimonas caeni TaxID=2058085 RepID=UPI002A36129D|nr:hypothetical protein [Arenimonas caeni]MDY0023189.1 hypothetical protein [Arenimonas caeni]
MSFEIIPVWKQVTPELKQELREFWERNKALSNGEQADMRAQQAVCVGRGEDGKICAVGTAQLRILPRLRQPTYYYRQFFDPGIRGQHQTVPFARRVVQTLQAYNAGLEKPESIGVVAELQNKMLAGRYIGATQVEAGFIFIGYSPRNCPMFVSYFEGAELKPPAPLRRARNPGAAASGRH